MGSYTPVPQSCDKASNKSIDNDVKVSLINAGDDDDDIADNEGPETSERDAITVV